MAPRNLADHLRNSLASFLWRSATYLTEEVAAWQRAFGWGLCFASIAWASRRAR